MLGSLGRVVRHEAARTRSASREARDRSSFCVNAVLPGIDGYETCRRLKDDPRVGTPR